MVVRPHQFDRVEGQPFVLVVRIGVDERYATRFCAGCEQHLSLSSHRGLVDLLHDRAVGTGSFGDLEPHVAFDDRDEVAPQTPRVRSVAPAHFEHVGESCRGDDACGGTLAFEQRVRADRRPVDHGADFVERVDRCPHAGKKAKFFVASGRRDLGDRELAGSVVDHEHVGECAAHVDPHYAIRLLCRHVPEPSTVV